MKKKIMNIALLGVIFMLGLFGAFFLYSFGAPYLGLDPNPEIGLGLGPYLFGVTFAIIFWILMSNVALVRKQVKQT